MTYPETLALAWLLIVSFGAISTCATARADDCTEHRADRPGRPHPGDRCACGAVCVSVKDEGEPWGVVETWQRPRP